MRRLRRYSLYVLLAVVGLVASPVAAQRGCGPTPCPICDQQEYAAVDPTEADATDDFLDLEDHAGSTTEANEDNYLVGIARTANRIRCVVDVAPGAGNDDWKMTLRSGVAGALSATTLTCNIDEVATSCDATVSGVTVGPDEVVTVDIDSSGPGANPAAAALMTCSICFGL